MQLALDYQHFCLQDRLKRENIQSYSSPPFNTFEDLPHIYDIIEKFRQVYDNPKDIDLLWSVIMIQPGCPDLCFNQSFVFYENIDI